MDEHKHTHINTQPDTVYFIQSAVSDERWRPRGSGYGERGRQTESETSEDCEGRLEEEQQRPTEHTSESLAWQRFNRRHRLNLNVFVGFRSFFVGTFIGVFNQKACYCRQMHFTDKLKTF